MSRPTCLDRTVLYQGQTQVWLATFQSPLVPVDHEVDRVHVDKNGCLQDIMYFMPRFLESAVFLSSIQSILQLPLLYHSLIYPLFQ